MMTMYKHICWQCQFYSHKNTKCPKPDNRAFDEGCEEFKYTNPEQRIDHLIDENKRLHDALTIAKGYVEHESTRTSGGQLYDIEQALKGKQNGRKTE